MYPNRCRYWCGEVFCWRTQLSIYIASLWWVPVNVFWSSMFL